MKKLILCTAATVLIASPALSAEPVAGRWLTQEKDAIVEIAPCGTALCGRLVKFLVPPPKGADQRDVNNPEASLRTRKLLGMAILTGFTDAGKEWAGKIYDPRKGKTYTSKLVRKSADVLHMKGCLGPFCQTQKWTRAK